MGSANLPISYRRVPRIPFRNSAVNVLSKQIANQELADQQDRHFRTDHLKKDLGGRSVRGGAVTLLAQLMKFLITTVATVVLARLLTPQDYGLIGMAVIVVNFVGMFPFLGLSTATMRWTELNHQQVSTLFWINLGLSALVMLVALGCAPLLAWFYHEPRIIGIMAGYALTIFLTGFYIQHEAILGRQMRFTAIAIIEVAAMLFGFGSAVVAAWLGARYWSLVINQLAMTLTTIAGVWMVCGWRPGFPARGTGVRSMLSYGGGLTGYQIVNYVARNIDNALIGKIWGAYQLGLYSRAYQMLVAPMQQINQPLGAVAVPALSRLSDSPERYRAAYLKIVEKIAMLTMPAVAFMIATSDWLVIFLLGEQWRQTSRIFMLLGIAAIAQPICRAVLWLFITQGRSQEIFKSGLVASLIAVAAIIGGLPWGAMGVAAAYATTDLCISTPLLFWYAGRCGPVRTSDLYRTIAPSACAALLSLGTVFTARQWLGIFDHLAVRLGVAFAMTAAVSFLVLMAFPGGRSAIRNSRDALLMLGKRESIVS
jgi:O-antigen/teichoic acid export membrane protein